MTTSAGAVPLDHFTFWLAAGERGISSEAIVSRLTGHPVGRWPRLGGNYPRDPADFRRCQLLLDAHPLARLHFGAMRAESQQWERLVDAWDEIHALLLDEAPDYLDPRSRGSAPKAYRLMRRVIADGTTCSDCDGTGNAEACEKCNGTGHRSGGRCRAQGCYRGHHLCATCRGDGYTGGDR